MKHLFFCDLFSSETSGNSQFSPPITQQHGEYVQFSEPVETCFSSGTGLLVSVRSICDLFDIKQQIKASLHQQ